MNLPFPQMPLDRVLIQPVKPKNQMSKERVLYLPDTAEKKLNLALVMGVGSGCKFAQVGALVVYGKYAGQPIEMNQETYIIVREEEILAFWSGHNVEELVAAEAGDDATVIRS